MDFAFTDEQEALAGTARQVLAEQAGSEALRRAMQTELGWDPTLWKRLAGELGWPAVAVPEAHGGLGLGAVEVAVLLEAAGEALLAAPLLSTLALGVPALREAGTAAQQQAWLPALAEGRALVTVAHAEPGWRELLTTDPARLATTARAEGSGFVLSGTKRPVLDGHAADAVVVSARTDDGGLGLFLVEAGTPGVERRRLPTLDPTRRLAELTLTDVRVPAEARMAGGAPALGRVLDLAVAALAAEQVGGAARCLEMTLEHARARVQFGRPIGSFQAVKHRCADMLLALEEARAGAYAAACHAEESPEELPVAASLAGATAGDAYFRCAADALQIHGGVGFTWEVDVHLHLKRARAGRALFASPAEHRDRVARHLGLDR